MQAIGLFSCILGAVFLPTAIYIYVKRMNGDFIRNPSLVEGVVVGASPVNYGDHHTARVRYHVDGKTYEVDGPLFEWGNFGPFSKCNLTDRKHLPNKLVAQKLLFPGVEWEVQPNDNLYRHSAISKLYPIGSTTDVWYDPMDPSHAYVERPVRRGVILVSFLVVWGIGLIAFGVIALLFFR